MQQFNRRSFDLTWKTIVLCTLTGAILGFILCWNVGDNCMMPPPTLAILAGFLLGFAGLVVGACISPVVVVVDKVVQRRHEDRRAFQEWAAARPQETLLRLSPVSSAFAPESSRRADSSLSDRFTQQNRFLLIGASYGICWDKMGVT